MTTEEQIKTTAGNYQFKNSFFIDNRGVRVTKEPSSLTLESSFFEKCKNEYAGAIYFFCGVSSNVVIDKVCGRCCALTKSNTHGVFYQIAGNQSVELLTYYDDVIHETSRETINHETGEQCVKNVNITNAQVLYRSFSYFNPNTGHSLDLKFCTTHNTTCNAEVLQVVNGVSSKFSYMSVIGCRSKKESLQSNSPGYYLFVTKITTNLYRCCFYNNIFNALFYGNPIISNCFLDYVSATTSESYIHTKYISYLNSFVCNVPRYKGDVKTCKKQFHNSFIVLS